MTARLLAGSALIALTAGGAFAQDLKFPVGEGAFNWDSYKAFDEATNLDGQTLTIFGPWRGEDQVLVESMLAYFEAASGVDVSYSSSEGYEQQIVIDAEAGSPPDVAVLPQPGLIGDLAAKGFVVPLGDETKTWLTDNYGAGASWAALGTYKGKDGADKALLDVVDTDWVVGQFDRVCVASGDHAFAPLARSLKGEGLHVTVVSLPRSVSAELYTAASEHLVLDRGQAAA